MNDTVRQLATFAPALIAQLKGNPVALEEFTRGYQATLAQQQEQRMRQQTMTQQGEDRQRLITRQGEQDRIAGEERDYQQTVRGQQDALRGLQIPGQLAELGATGETPDDAKALIESVMPRILQGFGQDAMAFGQPAVEMATRTITGRQKKAVEAYVEAAMKTAYVAENPDSDPELAQLPEHVAKIIGKPSARLSELQQFAQLPVGKPQGKTRTPAAAGSFEDYVAKKYGEAPTPEQIIEARKVYNQADDKAPTVNVNTGNQRTDARIDRLVSSFNSSPLVKEFNEIQAQSQTILQVVNNAWSGPGDMSIIFAFMKALDPNSVVRETEYANAAKSGNIFSGWAAKFNGKLNPSGGFLSDQVKADFLKTIEARMGVKKAQYDNLRTQTAKKIDRIKAGEPETGNEALIDYGSAFPADAGGGSDAAAAPTGYKVGQKVRNKKTGAMGEVTGVQPDGKPIIKPVSQ